MPSVAAHPGVAAERARHVVHERGIIAGQGDHVAGQVAAGCAQERPSAGRRLAAMIALAGACGRRRPSPRRNLRPSGSCCPGLHLLPDLRRKWLVRGIQARRGAGDRPLPWRRWRSRYWPSACSSNAVTSASGGRPLSSAASSMARGRPSTAAQMRSIRRSPSPSVTWLPARCERGRGTARPPASSRRGGPGRQRQRGELQITSTSRSWSTAGH